MALRTLGRSLLINPVRWMSLRGRERYNLNTVCLSERETFLVSAERGFLPLKDPPRLFKGSPQWLAWEHTAMDLPKLLELEKKNPLLRQKIESLPYLSAQYIMERTSEEEAWRMMCVISFIAHSYVWGGDCTDRLPPSLAAPWCKLSERLGVPPIKSYATYVLYNWRRLDPGKPVDVENIECVNSFTGCQDEEWFIAVHVSIEAKAGAAIEAMVEAKRAVLENNADKVRECLEEIARSMRGMQKTLKRMRERCDPDVYYNKIRKFLCGWRNNTQIPIGLLYDKERKLFYGASGAQSSIIPSLDSFLGIRHHHGLLSSYLQEMRRYMPRSHREFLEEIESGPSIREFAVHRRQELGEFYDECVYELMRFRWIHMEVAKMYASPSGREQQRLKGTGGTNAMSFLRQNVINTKNHMLMSE